MDERREQIRHILAKVDTIDTKLDGVDKHLAVYNEQLKVHIKRSKMLEDEFKPVKKHVEFVNFSTKLVSILSFIAALVLTVLTLVNH